MEVRPVFQPGLTYRFTNRTEIQMQFPARGSREAVIEQQARFDAGVRKDGKGGIALKGVTERLKVDLKSWQESINYDSLQAEDRKSRLGQHLNQSLTQWIDIKINRENRLVSAEVGGREATTSPLKGFPRIGTDELRQIVVIALQGMPEKKVRPGERWSIQGGHRLEQGGEMTFDIICRYRGEVEFEQNRFLQIDLTGHVSGGVAIPVEGEDQPPGPRMDFHIPSLTGRILFDPLERMIRLSEQTVNMVVELPAAPGEEPMRVPVKQRSVLNLLHIVPTP